MVFTQVARGVQVLRGIETVRLFSSIGCDHAVSGGLQDPFCERTNVVVIVDHQNRSVLRVVSHGLPLSAGNPATGRPRPSAQHLPGERNKVSYDSPGAVCSKLLTQSSQAGGFPQPKGVS